MLNDKKALKVVFLELLKEDKEFCQAVMKELNAENAAKAKRREEVLQSIDEDFKKYENVFKKISLTR